MQCIQFVRNVHNEHKRPRNSSIAIEHNIDVIVNAVQVLQYLFCHKRLQSNRPTSYHMLVIEQR